MCTSKKKNLDTDSDFFCPMCTSKKMILEYRTDISFCVIFDTFFDPQKKKSKKPSPKSNRCVHLKKKKRTIGKSESDTYSDFHFRE